MIGKLISFFVVVFIFLAGYYINQHLQSDPEKDFAKICLLVNEHPWSSFDDAVSAMAEFKNTLDSKIRNRLVRNTWRGIQATKANDRYGLFIDAAKKVGIENYDCPALEAYFAGHIY